jgi:hypothetical protein
MRVLLNGFASSRSNYRMGMKGDEAAQRGLAAWCSPNFYVYLKCITACLDFVHSFVFRTEYSISETRSVFDLTLKVGDVPSQLCPLDGCTGFQIMTLRTCLLNPSGSGLVQHWRRAYAASYNENPVLSVTGLASSTWRRRHPFSRSLCCVLDTRRKTKYKKQ